MSTLDAPESTRIYGTLLIPRSYKALFLTIAPRMFAESHTAFSAGPFTAAIVLLAIVTLVTVPPEPAITSGL